MSSEEELADEEIKTCTTCRRDGEQPCNGCQGAPDNDGRQLYSTYYCSGECQKVDYHAYHKYACKAARDRRALYRVGEIAQIAFYAYLVESFDVPIIKLEKQGDTLYVHQGRNDQNLILPFPSKLFTSEADELVALTALKCGNALGFVHTLVEKMLGRLVERVGRVDHIVKSFSRRVILIPATGNRIDNTVQAHSVLQVTFQNDEKFAVNITGAQYGHPEIVTPWHIYSKSRMETLKAVTPLKSIEECKKQMKKSRAKLTKEDEFAEVFGAAVEQWQRRNGSAYDMLQSRNGIYTGKKAMLLKLIHDRVKEHKAHMQNNGRLSRQNA